MERTWSQARGQLMEGAHELEMQRWRRILGSFVFLLVEQIFGGAAVDTSRSLPQGSLGWTEQRGRETDDQQIQQCLYGVPPGLSAAEGGSLSTGWSREAA